MDTIQQKNSEYFTMCKIGAISTVVVIIGIIIDIIIGTLTGGDLTALPQTAVGRFEQLHNNWMIGLYNLDLLNLINQLLMIPSYIALFIVLRDVKKVYALLALIIFLVGTVIFILNNSALIMLDLSYKYYAAVNESERILYTAAGEAMLAKGVHGGFNVFIGFLLPNIAGIIISVVMLNGKIFTKWTAYLGITGSILISLYVVMVTFLPETKQIATAIVAPGGIMLLIWMILFTKTLIRLSIVKAK